MVTLDRAYLSWKFVKMAVAQKGFAALVPWGENEAVALQLDAVALDGDVVHQVPPLVLEQVFAAFQAVEQEVACAWGEMFRVVVPGAVELKRDVSVDADGEVVVHDVHRLQGRKFESLTCS